MGKISPGPDCEGAFPAAVLSCLLLVIGDEGSEDIPDETVLELLYKSENTVESQSTEGLSKCGR